VAGKKATSAREDGRRVRTECARGPGSLGQLRVDRAALPGEQRPADPEEGHAQLDELGERPHRARGHDVRARTSARRHIRRDRLRARRHDLDAILQRGRRDDGLQESRLLANGLDEADLRPGDRRREREAGEPAAAPEVEQAERGSSPASADEEREGGQAVGDVEGRDGGRLDDRGQVDRGIPGEQEPDMALDRVARPLVEVYGEGVEGVVERDREGGREVGQVPDTRRERFSLAVQMPSSGLRIRRREPPPAFSSRFQVRRSDAPRSVRGRVSPCPFRAAFPDGRPGADAGR
jgi:hypothetical protein